MKFVPDTGSHAPREYYRLFVKHLNQTELLKGLLKNRKSLDHNHVSSH